MHALNRTHELMATVRQAQRAFGARLSRRAAQEEGFILIIAIVILMITIVTIGAVAVSANHAGQSVERSAASASAQAAADAGAQAALLRLNVSGGSTGETGSLGNGATFSYGVTGASGSSCSGLQVKNSTQTIDQDCITSVGTDNGVSARVQERVAAFAPTTLFPVDGVFAINSLSTTSSPTGTFDMGTNGSSNLHGEGETGKLEYPSNNPPNYNGAQNTCGTTGNTGCVADPLSSAITVPTVSASYYQAASQSNNDAAISWVDNSHGCTAGQVTYTASTSQVSGTSNGCVFNIPSGTYYFCNVDFSGSTTLDVTPPAYFYIDSTADPLTSCAANTGYFESGNQFEIVNGPNNTGSASGVQIYLYGNPPCTSSCPTYFNPNGSTLNAYVFAPYAAFAPGGAFTMVGALVTASLTTNNAFTFTYQAPTTPLAAGSSQATYYPVAHQVCTPSGGTAGTC